MAVIELSPELLQEDFHYDYPLTQETETVNPQNLPLEAVPLYDEVRLDNCQHWSRLQKLAEFTCMRLDVREAWNNGDVLSKIAVIPKVAELAISGQLKGVLG